LERIILILLVVLSNTSIVFAAEEAADKNSFVRTWEKARETLIIKYSEALEKNPNDAVVYCRRANVYFEADSMI